MKKYLVLILSGSAGYVLYPTLAPALLGVKVSQEIVEDAPVNHQDSIPPAKEPLQPKTVAKPASKPAAKPFGISAKMQKEDIIPDKPIAPKPVDNPVQPELPIEEELTSVDFENIITAGVESGKYIKFREENIIEWRLVKQELSKVNDQYVGLVTVETGNLFGKAKRSAEVTIKKEAITKWDWLESNE